jgi:hypothetical protein
MALKPMGRQHHPAPAIRRKPAIQQRPINSTSSRNALL